MHVFYCHIIKIVVSYITKVDPRAVYDSEIIYFDDRMSNERVRFG